MFTRQELEKKVLAEFTQDALPRVADTMQQIQNKICLNTREGSFVTRLVEGNINYAKAIADAYNKEVLTTNFYQDFIEEVKRGAYMRDKKFSKI